MPETLYGRRRDALTSVLLFLLVAALGYGEMALARSFSEAAGMAVVVRYFVLYPSLIAACLLAPWLLAPGRAFLTVSEGTISWRLYPGLQRQQVDLSEVTKVALDEKHRYVTLKLNDGSQQVIGYNFGLDVDDLRQRIVSSITASKPVAA